MQVRRYPKGAPDGAHEIHLKYCIVLDIKELSKNVDGRGKPHWICLKHNPAADLTLKRPERGTGTTDAWLENHLKCHEALLEAAEDACEVKEGCPCEHGAVFIVTQVEPPLSAVQQQGFDTLEAHNEALEPVMKALKTELKKRRASEPQAGSPAPAAEAGEGSERPPKRAAAVEATHRLAASAAAAGSAAAAAEQLEAAAGEGSQLQGFQLDPKEPSLVVGCQKFGFQKLEGVQLRKPPSTYPEQLQKMYPGHLTFEAGEGDTWHCQKHAEQGVATKKGVLQHLFTHFEDVPGPGGAVLVDGGEVLWLVDSVEVDEVPQLPVQGEAAAPADPDAPVTNARFDACWAEYRADQQKLYNILAPLGALAKQLQRPKLTDGQHQQPAAPPS